MEGDGVLTFESFHKIDENYSNGGNSVMGIIQNMIERPTDPIKYEKVIADKYNVSLGHVEEFDLDKHEYNVEIPGHESLDVFILSKDDIEPIKSVVIEKMYQDLIKDTLKLNSFDTGIDLGDIIKYNDFENSLLDESIDDKKVLEILDVLLSGEDYSDHIEYKGYYIWER
jgi:hypothetical protein